jgi:Mg-chelatase subunit ChlD
VKPTRSFAGTAAVLAAAVAATFMAASMAGLSSCTPRHRGAKGYTLQFGKDFKAGMNSVDDLGLSIVLLVDVSGSMADPPSGGGEPKYVQAAQAFGTIAGFLESFASRHRDLVVKVAILKFSEKVSLVLPLTTLDERGKRALTDAASNPKNFYPEGKTAIGSALEAGSELLAGSGTIFRSMIVVTDGESNIGTDPSEVIDAIYADRNSASTKDLPVGTATQLLSFVGFDSDSGSFGPFRDRGARITSAQDQAGLESGLKGLLEADITKLEAAP